ncbi:MAG TPA: branched-chain amino acid ABC transporter substrate-binding protein, partial [Ktedonobacteraceae bacterium]
MKKSRMHMSMLLMILGCLTALLVACGTSAVAAGNGSSTSNNQLTLVNTHNHKKSKPTPTPTPVRRPTPTSNPTIIKIGLDLPLSGVDASLGQSAENGALLAINQANANKVLPGYTFQLIAKDDANATTGLPDATIAIQNVTALIQDAQVAGIIGAFDTTTAEAELPIANKAGIALLSPSATYTCLTQASATANCGTLLNTLSPTGKTTFFRLAPTDLQQGEALADFAYQTKGYRKVYVIDDTSAYGVGLANGFVSRYQADFGTLLGRMSAGQMPSYLNLLTQIAVLKPDAIFYAGSDSEGTTIRQQMLRIASLTNIPFLGGNGIHTMTFANAIAPMGGGPNYSTELALMPTTGTFVQQYQAAYGTPGSYSVAGYDSVNILLAALKATIAGKLAAPTSSSQTTVATTFRSSVINGVTQTNYTGVTGIQYTFTAGGDALNNTIEVDVLAGSQWTANTTEQVV